jgi:carbonic anhydrase/acetyltransferase-like protein (isoleucine patch superfamily)
MIHPSVKIFPGARVKGEVNIGEGSSIWFNTVIRGDIEPINIGCFCNVQESCVLHSSRGYPLDLGDYVSVGHGAVLHGSKIDDNTMVGINATLLNGSRVRKNSMVGAGAVVTQGKDFPEGSLILGVPARAVRKLGPGEIKKIKENALNYSKLAGEKIEVYNGKGED